MSKATNKGVANSNNDVSRWIGQRVIVKFVGGREVTGLLRGYDTLVNLVLDECVETIRDPQDPYKLTDDTRSLGLVVARGTSVMLIMPLDGRSEVDNPWQAKEEPVL